MYLFSKFHIKSFKNIDRKKVVDWQVVFVIVRYPIQQRSPIYILRNHIMNSENFPESLKLNS